MVQFSGRGGGQSLGKLGSVSVEVRANLKGYKKQMKEAENVTQKASKGMSKSIKKMGKATIRTTSGMTGGFEKVRISIARLRNLTLLTRFAMAALGFVAIRAIKDVTAAFNKQESAEKQLEQRLKSTGHAAGLTADELKKMASALQQVTTVGDETIIEAQGLLLTFTKIGRDVFPQAIKAVLNMSQALGQDLKSSALQLGKALNDPILGMTALRRVGVNFNKSQVELVKNMVDSNDILGAQKFILAELEIEFGGAAEAARDTFGGKNKALANAFGDTMEIIGQKISQTTSPAVRLLTNDLIALNKVLGEEPKAEVRSFIFEGRFDTIGLSRALDDLKSKMRPLIDEIDRLREKFGAGAQFGRIGKVIEKLTVKLRPLQEEYQRIIAIQDLSRISNIILAESFDKVRESIPVKPLVEFTETLEDLDDVAGIVDESIRQLETDQKDLKRIFIETRTETELFDAALLRLHVLLLQYPAAADSIRRAMDQLHEAFIGLPPEFKEASKEAVIFEQSFSSAFGSAQRETKLLISFIDELARALQRLAAQQLATDIAGLFKGSPTSLPGTGSIDPHDLNLDDDPFRSQSAPGGGGVTVVNAIGVSDMENFMTSRDGQNVILNVIQANAGKVRAGLA